MPLVARLKVALLVPLACLLATAGCSPPPALPPPIPLRLIVAPATRRLAAELAKEYATQQPRVQVEISEGSAEEALQAVAGGHADLALIERSPAQAESLDPTSLHPRLRASPFAVDRVAVIVHPANPVESLSTAQLRSVFEGEQLRWAGLGGEDTPIELVSREPGAPARTAFEDPILRGKHIAGSAVVMPGDQAVADYVAGHPEAIGYVSSAWIRDDVKVIRLDGMLPGPGTASRSYPLSHPLVMVTRIGPAGKVRAFLGFVSGHDGRNIIGKLYAPLP
jgi:phosphate transport system substrate-binding protein